MNNVSRPLQIVAFMAIGWLPTVTSPLSQTRQPDVQYTITDLGTLPKCDVTYATALNNAGSVAGYAYTFSPPGHGNALLSRPFVWRNGKRTELPAFGGEHGQALSINARGDVAGYADTADYASLPVVWGRARRFTPERLGGLPGRVTCLLDDGTAAGAVFKDKTWRAAVWVRGKLSCLEDGEAEESVCKSINGKGIAVGYFVPKGGARESSRSAGDRHAAIWREGHLTALPELGGRLSECQAINDTGIAVGWCDDKNGRSACAWKGGTVTRLSAPDPSWAEAHGINRQGVIVGDVREKSNRWYACRWVDSKAEDLNRLVAAGSGWHLTVAFAINDRGQIVGIGTNDQHPHDRWRAFLLTPSIR